MSWPWQPDREWERAWGYEPPPTLSADTALAWRLEAQQTARVWSRADPSGGWVELTEADVRRWLYVRWLYLARGLYREEMAD